MRLEGMEHRGKDIWRHPACKYANYYYFLFLKEIDRTKMRDNVSRGIIHRSSNLLKFEFFGYPAKNFARYRIFC